MSGAIDAAKAALTVLTFVNPVNLGCVVRSVSDVLEPSEYIKAGTVKGMNAGINARFQRYVDNPCFRDLAVDFWSKISSEIDPSYEEKKPGLSEAAGQGRFAGHPPGWVFGRALEATGGNKYLAIQLVGMCMHDDTAQVYRRTLDPEKSIREWERRIETARGFLKQIDEKYGTPSEAAPPGQKELAEFYKSSTLETIRRQSQFLADKTAATVEIRKCPKMNSALFAPKAVDASLDVPDSLKKQLYASQRPGQSNPHIPAKAYHFAAASILGCELSQCHLNADEAGMVASVLAKAYRVHALTPKIEQLLRDRREVERTIKTTIDQADFPARSRAFTQTRNEGLLRESPAYSFEREYDAAALYADWYIGGASGIGSGWRTKGPKSLDLVDPATDPAHSTLCGYPEWTVERCRLARVTIGTWDMDETWTRAQHTAGAKFGHNACAGSNETSRQPDTLCAKAQAPSPATSK